jgi:type IV pilus assembly protein PilY1
LNGGGRGYFALDITDPTNPKFLWEIDSSTDKDLGYSFGPAVVTKKADGTWVVLLTSGYNNINPGDGKGYLYVRKAYTGEAIAKIGTGEGDTTTPSGLGKIGNWADDPTRNNTSVYAYVGDLSGSVWRFDINAETMMKFALLKDKDGNTQPITTAPELGVINSKRVIFVATGKYLETDDLTNKQQQSIYAIKDDNVKLTLDNPRSSLKQQTIAHADGAANRTASGDVVDFNNDLGWYVDLPDVGERSHVDPKLDSGTLIVPTTVPSNTVCEPGGYGWLNYFNYRTGNNGENSVSQRFNGAIVGVNVFYTTDGKRHVTAVQYNKPEPEEPKDPLPPPDGPSGFAGKRVIWRELNP